MTEKTPVLLSQVKPDPSGKAIQFITIDEKSGKFEVTTEAMMFLESLPRHSKLAVVSIAGPYRTGKSFLANRLLNQSKGFDIGSTTQACTKGIWMWNRPVPLSADLNMILIDTEGLASTERSTNIDIKIFSLSILLASLFIYNQMGPITEHSLEDLALVGNLTQHIQVSAQKSSEPADFKAFFPSFFWVLRDFYHDLEGKTPKDYLEDCLKEAPGYSADLMKKNRIRAAIAKHFKEREAFTMIRPITDEQKLAHIEQIAWDTEGLKPEFKKQVAAFVNTVGKKVRPKMVAGKVLNPSMFLQLVLEYTESLSSKDSPVILTALDRVVQAETQKILDENYDHFKHRLSEDISEDHLPMSAHELRKALKRVVREARGKAERELALVLGFKEIQSEEVIGRFLRRVEELEVQKINQNYNASYHFSKGLLQNLLTLVTPGEMVLGTHEYLKRWSQLIKEYKESSTQSALQWQIFADSLLKLPPSDQAFIKRDLIEPLEGPVHRDMEQDDMYESQPALSDDPHSLHLLSSLDAYLHALIASLQAHLESLRGTLSEAQTQARQLSYSVKHSEQQEDLLKTQGSELRDLVGELEARGEAVTRELNARRDEIQAVTQIKEAEIRQTKTAQDKAIRELADELASLTLQKTALETQHQTLLSKVTELETEKRKEMSQVQQDIRKLEQDIEGLQSKLRTKENNPHFQQVNEFFTQVKEVYMAEYRALIGQRVQDQLKERKKAMFDSQRQLAEVEYRVQQRELEVKKGLDEELRRHKEGLDSQEEEQKVTKIDNERLRLQAMIDRRTQQESQLTGVIGQIQEAKERLMAVMEQRDNQRRVGVSLKEAKLRALDKDLEEVKQGQIRMEDKIYMLSLENKQRQDDKEIMLMLLPHILKTIKGQPNNLKGIMQQMDSEGLKNKVMKLLQAYKIPGIK